MSVNKGHNHEHDYGEVFCDCMNYIVDEKMKQAPFNKVEIATIEQIKGKNTYIVNNGSIKYEVKGSSGTTYNQNDKVHVMIPRNDYREEKIIIGDYLYNTISTLQNVSPSEAFVDMTGNLVTRKDELQLIANSETYTNPTLKDVNQIIDKEYSTKNKDYDTIFIKADFKNTFDLTQGENAGPITMGNFGLVLHGIEYDPENKKSNKFFCFLDTSDMIGDVYNFSSYFPQEKNFSINPKYVYKNLKLQFFQNIKGYIEKDTVSETAEESDNKKNIESGMEWEWLKDENGFKRLNINFDGSNSSELYIPHVQNGTYNLFVKNIEVRFGYGLDQYEKDTILLLTENEKTFSNEDRTRRLSVRWIHFDSDRRPWAIKDLTHKSLSENSVKIRWYRENQNPEKKVKDDLAGDNWIEMEQHYGDFNCTVNLKKDVSNERFKVFISLDGVRYWSDILEFTNPEIKQIQELSPELSITYPEDDEECGNFYFYSSSDKTASSKKTKKIRTLNTNLTDKDGQNINYAKKDILVWLIPSYNTMIATPELGKEYEENDIFIKATNEDGEESKQFGDIIIKSRKKYHVIAKQIVKGNDLTSSLNYRLKNNFLDTNTRNTIVCYYYPKGFTKRQAKSSIEFSFGTTGSEKKEYFFDLDWEEITIDQRTFQNPSAITWSWDNENYGLYQNGNNISYLNEKNNLLSKDNVDSTKSLTFLGSIVSENGKILVNKKPVTLSFYKAVGIEGSGYYANDYMTIENNVLLIKNVADFPKTQDKKPNGDLVRILPYTLLEASLTYKGKTFSKIFPLPIRRYRHIYGLTGCTDIFYDATGYNPVLNNDENYELGMDEGIKTVGIQSDMITVSQWTMHVADNNNNANSIDYPRLNEKNIEGTKEYSMLAPTVYLPRKSSNPTIYSAVGVRAVSKYNNERLWAQPIYVHFDKDGSDRYFAEELEVITKVELSADGKEISVKKRKIIFKSGIAFDISEEF